MSRVFPATIVAQPQTETPPRLSAEPPSTSNGMSVVPGRHVTPCVFKFGDGNLDAVEDRADAAAAMLTTPPLTAAAADPTTAGAQQQQPHLQQLENEKQKKKKKKKIMALHRRSNSVAPAPPPQISEKLFHKLQQRVGSRASVNGDASLPATKVALAGLHQREVAPALGRMLHDQQHSVDESKGDDGSSSSNGNNGSNARPDNAVKRGCGSGGGAIRRGSAGGVAVAAATAAAAPYADCVSGVHAQLIEHVSPPKHQVSPPNGNPTHRRVHSYPTAPDRFSTSGIAAAEAYKRLSSSSSSSSNNNNNNRDSHTTSISNTTANSDASAGGAGWQEELAIVMDVQLQKSFSLRGDA
jgi:hypothetical protein